MPDLFWHCFFSMYCFVFLDFIAMATENVVQKRLEHAGPVLGVYKYIVLRCIEYHSTRIDISKQTGLATLLIRVPDARLRAIGLFAGRGAAPKDQGAGQQDDPRRSQVPAREGARAPWPRRQAEVFAAANCEISARGPWPTTSPPDELKP